MGAADGGSREGDVMIYEVVMDDGSTIRVTCARVDIGMDCGRIASMQVWPPEGGDPYQMRLPEQDRIAIIRATARADVPNRVACP